MEQTPLLSVLPNLSIAAVAIVALVYVIVVFIKHLERRDKEHATEIKERELHIRSVEREVRESVLNQLQKNTAAFEKVAVILDNPRRR